MYIVVIIKMSNKTSNSNYISVQIIDDSDSESDGEIEVGFENKTENTNVLVVEKNEIKELSTPEVKKGKRGVKKDKADKADKEKTDKKPRTKEKKIKDIKEKDIKEKDTKETDLIKETVIPECLLSKFYNSEPHIIEIGADEAGRGPMFGRVYSGAVVLPKDDSFDHYKMKDSKKFTSKNSKKINEVAEYIKQHALAWAVCYEDERVIDEINILQATQSAMHKAIKAVINQLKSSNKIPNQDYNNLFLLIDGNYFKPLSITNDTDITSINTNGSSNKKFHKINNGQTLQYRTIEGGDNKYTAIAAASILAKVERDKYIDDLCSENPDLIEKYGLDSNKGYGSKKHMDGIKQYGISKWHRRSFGICKDYA
jgi:ribonuclease HII